MGFATCIDHVFMVLYLRIFLREGCATYIDYVLNDSYLRILSPRGVCHLYKSQIGRTPPRAIHIGNKSCLIPLPSARITLHPSKIHARFTPVINHLRLDLPPARTTHYSASLFEESYICMLLSLGDSSVSPGFGSSCICASCLLRLMMRKI